MVSVTVDGAAVALRVNDYQRRSAIRARADESFPVEVLDGCESALLMFAGGFHGANDGVHVADAGIADVTCVDVRAEGLNVMADLYPDTWEFVVAEAFEYAAAARRRWDLVVVDCPTGLFDRCARMTDVWASLARRSVVLGCGARTIVDVPDGWTVSGCVRRSDFRGGVYWTVMEPTS